MMLKRISTKLVFLLLLAGSLQAQDKGMQFFHGSWSELLAEAKKTNKLIFVDVYTEWCGPCKLMVKNVFPLENVGDKYNSGFINYKLDAEKGEGIELTQQFKVQGFPTYLYLSSNGDLLHRGIGYFEPDKFMKNADIAVTSAADPVSIGQMTQEYESGKKDKEFLKAYISKLLKLELTAAKPLDDYFTTLSKDEKAKEETKLFLLQGVTLENKDVLAFLMQNPKELLEISKRSGITTAIGFSLTDLLSTNLMQGAHKALNKEEYDNYLLYRNYYNRIAGADDWGSSSMLRMNLQYFSGTGKIDSLQKYATSYATTELTTPVDSFKQRDARAFANFMKPYLEGKKDSTKDDYFPKMKPSAGKRHSMEAAGKLNAAAQGFGTTKATVKKSLLQEALKWNQKAMLLWPEYENFKITQAQLLYKLGQKQEAKKIIDSQLVKARESKSTYLLQSLEKVRSEMF